MTLYICGIMHKVIEVEDIFYDGVTHFGDVDYKNAVIKINKDMNIDIKRETLCHEILHVMLTHLGYDSLSEDEQFVNALSNAMNQSFEVRKIGNFTGKEDE